MTRIIACVSGKGGVGKTTIVSNLGVTLAKIGKKVTVIDANITTPNLGLHLGLPFYPVTLQDVLRGTRTIKDATYEHDSGLKVVPAGIALKDLKGTDPRNLPNILLDLLGDSDIILLDVAAGLGRETLSALEAADEIVLITNPEVPAVTDALKAVKLAQQIGTKISGVVINRATGRRHEMKIDDVMSMLGDYELLGIVPEDVSVQKSIAARAPVVNHCPRSPASKELHRVAARLIGAKYYEDSWYKRIFGFLR